MHYSKHDGHEILKFLSISELTKVAPRLRHWQGPRDTDQRRQL